MDDPVFNRLAVRPSPRGWWAWVLALLLGGCHEPRVADPISPSPPTVTDQWLVLQPGLRVSPSRGEVEFEAEVCLEEGWLEQVVCGPGTREHESILVTRIPASSIHAAMLAAGFEPGRPGYWTTTGQVPPTGSEVDVLVSSGESNVFTPIRSWVRGLDGGSPEGPWVFGGSSMRAADTVPEGTSRYEADLSGSVVGLVTFGDETIGFQDVIPDRIEVQPEEWRVGQVPPVGTRVLVLVRSADG